MNYNEQNKLILIITCAINVDNAIFLNNMAYTFWYIYKYISIYSCGQLLTIAAFVGCLKNALTLIISQYTIFCFKRHTKTANVNIAVVWPPLSKVYSIWYDT